MSLSIIVTWIQQKILDETISDSTLRYVGMAASTLATILYLIRYHNSNSMMKELSYYDYRQFTLKLSLVQKLSLVGKHNEIKSIENILKCSSGCLGACIWGKDLKTNESIILEAFRRSKVRFYHLNFGHAPWSGSFNRVLERMEETSNPLWSFLKQMANLFSNDSNNNNKDENSGYSDPIIMEEKLCRYKTLLLEKYDMIQRTMDRDKKRVLVYFIEGLDKFSELDINVGGMYGRKIIRIMIQSFMDFAEANPERFRVIYSITDKFWWRYWSGNAGTLRKCVSLHIGESDPILVRKAWETEYKHLGLDKLNEIVMNWGTNSREMMRIVSAYQLPTCIGLHKLVEEDILQFVFMWLNDRYYTHQNIPMNYLYDILKAGTDEEGALSSDKEILDMVASLELDVFRLLASSELGLVPLRQILRNANGSKLFQAAINLVRKDFLALSVVTSSATVSCCYKTVQGMSESSQSSRGHSSMSTVASVLPECLEGIVLCTRKKIDVLSIRYICTLMDSSSGSI